MIINKYADQYLRTSLNEPEPYTDLFVVLGELKKPIIASSIKIVEQKLRSLEYPIRLITRAKLVAVELLDNMLKHQKQTPLLSSYFECFLSENNLKFTASNCVSEEDAYYLDSQLKKYIELPTEEVEKLYLNELKYGTLDEEGNAGLGLLTLLKRTGQKVEYKIEKVKDNHYYFYFTINIENQSN